MEDLTPQSINPTPSESLKQNEEAKRAELEKQEILQILLQKDEKSLSTMMVNPSVVESLAHHQPSALIEFADKNDQRQFDYHSQLAKHKDDQNKRRENTNRMILGSIVGMILMSFIYSGVTGDKTLPDKLINIVVGGGAGIGLSHLTKNKNKDE
ncbi:hypothetical protein Syn7502_01929 [Synechococcus sp. PCC 7502]|uniref:hypothetical protein n=1 Tax=Synechococcus sp. PCC 7502 TaxID=1173263 RepID=UPI00029FB6E4|nr:hypothetical protein [Synechococcus sp. PCC 7502]AFY73961.1 hypothetical protein Syn7502_01929 [Synechococcus sp. PCC 7502]